MKRADGVVLTVVWIASAPSPASGQWTGGPTGPIYYNGGNVGIGAINPIGKLHVTGLGGPASAAFKTYTMARFSDGGQYSNSAVVFDTGGTGAAAFRGFTIGKNSQTMLASSAKSVGR